MSNVGDTKTFTLGGTQTEGFRYVWNWWDNTVNATPTNTVTKVLNKGGNPADAYSLRYHVEAVDALGRSGIYSDLIAVNNPPSVVVGSARVTDNGKFVTYFTTASVQMYDLEDHALSFNWSSDSVNLGNGTVVPIGVVPGTYNGTYVGDKNGYEVSLFYQVERTATIVLTATDSEGSSTEVAFPLYGYYESAPYFAPTVGPESLTGDASSQPVVTIGEGATFTIYSAPGASRTVFIWGFWGTNGWEVPTSSNGESTVLPDGSVRNIYTKVTTGEQPGQKLAEVAVYDVDTDTYVLVTIPVSVIQNDPPANIGFATTPAVPAAGNTIRFRGEATDPDSDILTYKWVFNTPSTTLWGRTVYLNTSGLITGQTVDGTLYVTDRLGETITKAINIVLA
jgi:hypothetical protein